jgi:hypothetical protein
VTAAVYPLAVYRGDSAGWRFVLWADPAKTQPFDLTGAKAAAQIRDRPDSTNIVNLVCTVTLPNTVDVALPPAAAAVTPSGGWDLQITGADGTVTTVVAGPVKVTADITQP